MNLLTQILIIIAWVGFVVLLFFAWEKIKQRYLQYRYDRRMQQLLNGRSLAEVLAEAPYGYGHWQGEDGYRVYDTRIKEGYIGMTMTKQEAEMMIVERYSKEAGAM